MAFTESTKLKVRRNAHFQCCLCKALGVEIHHIIPQEEGGPDTEENAAPLCPSCHETYGANTQKRKFILEARDFWYEICKKRYASDSMQLDDIQRVLASLDSFVRSSNYPLVPFAMFYTLRHTTTEEAIKDAFKNSKGFKSLNTSLLKLTGSARLGGSVTYNPIMFEPKQSHCTLTDEDRKGFIKNQGYIGESAIKNPIHTKLEFFFRSSIDGPEEPSLTLTKAFNGRGKPDDVVKLELYDNTVFQDTFVTAWVVENPTKTAWNISHLQNARIRLVLEFWSYNKINFEEPPRFHNLHFYFGKENPHVICFSIEQLDRLTITKDSHIPIHLDFSGVGLDASPLSMIYEFAINDEMFCNQIKQLG